MLGVACRHYMGVIRIWNLDAAPRTRSMPDQERVAIENAALRARRRIRKGVTNWNAASRAFPTLDGTKKS